MKGWRIGWLAKDAPGVDDYAAFAKAAVERQVILGAASSNKILLALARGQTELYRALVDVRAIPYLIDITTKVDGTGFLAALVRKVVTGTRTSTVTKVSPAPLADDLFVIPEGWKQERKK